MSAHGTSLPQIGLHSAEEAQRLQCTVKADCAYHGSWRRKPCDLDRFSGRCPLPPCTVCVLRLEQFNLAISSSNNVQLQSYGHVPSPALRKRCNCNMEHNPCALCCVDAALETALELQQRADTTPPELYRYACANCHVSDVTVTSACASEVIRMRADGPQRRQWRVCAMSGNGKLHIG